MPAHLHFRTFGLLAAVAAAACMLASGPVLALDSNSQQVRGMVQKSLAYLSTATDKRLGGICLIGLCYKKADQASHPKVLEALKLCESANLNDPIFVDNYSLGIALAFLCDVDPEGQKQLIQKYVDELLARQKPYGAWGYREFQTGDTSQTQYAVLGMWMAKKYANIDIPIDRQEGVCRWLMLTQDPSGGWSYQGHLDRKQQDPVTPTLSAAGAGSLYMVADLLQVTTKAEKTVSVSGKPTALQEVAEKKDAKGPLTRELDPGEIKNTLANGDRWMAAHFVMPAENWNHYYMYALERYHSFRENGTGVKDDRWYDSGVSFLAKTQKENGCWDGQDNATVATSLATLFLLRSSQKTIVIQKKLQMGDGIARAGGIRLPKDIKSLQVTEGGKLVDPGIAIPTEQILQLINSGESEEVTRRAEEREALLLSSNKSERDSQIEKLRKFVGAGDYNARMVAVTTLGKVRDLDNVPRLLYALTDPESAIVLQADKGLRFISRKVDGVGLPESEPTRDQIKAARAAWKAWYLSIRPNADLLD